MSLRPATEADIAKIRAIAHATWPVAYGAIITPGQLGYMLGLMYSSESLLAQMQQQGHRFLLFHEEGVAQGFASYEQGYNGLRSTRLHKLYVIPTAQGTGVGRTLLHAVVAAAREAKDLKVELNVNRFNTARWFYERHGFRIVRDEVINIGQGYVMDDHVMKLELHP